MKKALLIITFAFISLLSILTLVKVKAENTFTVTTTEGVSVRLTEPMGIRFAASVTGTVPAGAEYGFLFADGKQENITQDTPGVKFFSVDETNADGEYFMSLVNGPDRAYLNDITCRAAIKVGTTYTLASNQVVRNLYEVCKSAKTNGQSNAYIDGIVDNAKLIVTLHTGTELYNHAAIAQDFVNDFKEYTGRTDVKIETFFDNTYSGAGTPLGYNFLTSEQYSFKWGWLLDFINDVRKANGKSAIVASSGQAYTRGEIHNWLNNNNSSSYGSDYSNLNNRIYKLVMTPQEFTPLTMTKADYSFLGWYKNSSFEGTAITSVTSNCDLYPKAELKDGFSINYVYNGGNTKYRNYDEVVEDLLNDYNNSGLSTTKYTLDTLPMGNFDLISNGFAPFYYKSINGVYMREKWSWLVDYLLSVNKIEYGCKDATRTNFAKINNYLNETEQGNIKYAGSYMFRAFMKKTQIRPNCDWQTTNFSLESTRMLYIEYLSASENTRVEENKPGTVINQNLFKEGYTFGGWYDNPEFTGEAVTVVNQAVTLYAKWVPVN